jgi:hypothetical protein
MNNKLISRSTALLYMIVAIIAPFSMIYVPTSLVVPGDAAATASRIAASQGLFRASIASDAAIFLIEIVLTALLYVLLRPVNRTLALASAFARLAMTIVQGLNLLNHLTVLIMLSGAGFLTVFTAPQLSALAMVFLQAHSYAAQIWGLFFGLHLLAAGTLVYRSGYIPKALGIVLWIVGLCYLAQGFGNILLPQFAAQLAALGMVMMIELAFPLWLLIKGVPDQKLSA